MPKLPFLPKALRELLDYISPLAFEVIDWQSIVKASSPLIKQLITGQGVDQLAKTNATYLPEMIQYNTGLGGGEKFSTNDLIPTDRTDLGEAILAMYFNQLKADAIFIDLRLSRFRKIDSDSYTFKPNGMWTPLSSSFRGGVVDMYCGFYHDDEERYERGLSALGMTPDHMSDEKRAELKKLLQEHFGEGRQQAVPFSIKKFSKSFHQLFDFFLKNRIRLGGEFLFLGLYLVTLYLALDSLGQEYDVRGAFHECFPQDAEEPKGT